MNGMSKRSLFYNEDCLGLTNLLEIHDISKFAILADTHLFMHSDNVGCIQRARGFSSNEEHDKFIMKSMEESGVKDFLILGDMFWDYSNGTTPDEFTNFSNWLISNDFHIWLVPGNHDDFINFRQQLNFEYNKYNFSNWTIVPPMTHLIITDRAKELVKNNKDFQTFPKSMPVILTHYPIMPHVFNNGNVINLCGHLHGTNGFRLDNAYTWDMGVDNAIKETGNAYFKLPLNTFFPDW